MSEEEKRNLEIGERDDETVERLNIFEKHFNELAGRKPVTVWYTNPPLCPKCGDTLYIQFIKPHWFPYQHVDMMLKCPMCLEELLFGIPQSKDSGLALHIWDTNPWDAMKLFETLDTPMCQYRKHGKMLPTKIFGDWFEKYDDKLRFQWKCPVCYMVFQVTHPRTFPHGDIDPLSEEEKAIITKRLQDMGYIE